MRTGVGERGQMTVELAVTLPVAIVVGLIGYNLVRFSAACARFDRVALDSVLSQGVSASGSDASASAAGDVRSAIEGAMGQGDGLTVEVSEAATGLDSPGLTRFTCSFSMAPWPASVIMPGLGYGAPELLRHERAIVVDRYRPGVLL